MKLRPDFEGITTCSRGRSAQGGRMKLRPDFEGITTSAQRPKSSKDCDETET